jgi:hypothetical protein
MQHICLSPYLIRTFTNLSEPQITKALTVLIQHDIVSTGYQRDEKKSSAASSKKRDASALKDEANDPIDKLINLVQKGSGPALYALRIPAIQFRCFLAKCAPHVASLEGEVFVCIKYNSLNTPM